MIFNIHTFYLVSDDYFINLASVFFKKRLDLRYPLYQIINITSKQLDIAQKVSESNDKYISADVEMLLGDTIYKTEVTHGTCISIIRHGLAMYMLCLVIDFMNGGTQYLLEKPSISLEIIEKYKEIVNETKIKLGIPTYEMHSDNDKLKPGTRLTPYKQTNTATWWN